MLGEYGQSGNVFVEFVNNALLAVLSYPPRKLVLSESFEKHIGSGSFDLQAAVESWGCIAKAIPCDSTTSSSPREDVVTLFAEDSYWRRSLQDLLNSKHASLEFNKLADLLAAQIFLRPTPVLREAMEAFLDTFSVGGKKAPYLAVHLRSFEGTCVNRSQGLNLELSQTVHRRDMPAGRAVGVDDVCTMSDAYIEASLRELSAMTHKKSSTYSDTEVRVVLVHDGQNLSRAAEIQRRFNATTYEGPHKVFADLLLLVQSSFFVAHPMSTFALAAAGVRRAMLGSSFSNLRDVPPSKGRGPQRMCPSRSRQLKLHCIRAKEVSTQQQWCQFQRQETARVESRPKPRYSDD
jgi:hypothetical protein